MAFKSSCNVCFRRNIELINLRNGDNLYKLYAIVQLLADPEYMLDAIDFWVCASCRLMLKRILTFQQKLCKTQQRIANLISNRADAEKPNTTSLSPTSVVSVSSHYPETKPNVVQNIQISDYNVRYSDGNDDSPSITALEVHDVDDEPDLVYTGTFDLGNDDHLDDKSNQCSDNDSDLEPLIKIKHKASSLLLTPSSESKARSTQDPLSMPAIAKDAILSAIDDINRRFLGNSKCCVCELEQVAKESLKAHMTDAHKNDASIWCITCNLLIEELQSHKCCAVTCQFCEQSFDNPTLLVDHLRTHLDNDTVNMKEIFVRKDIYQTKSSEALSKKRYICRRCKVIETDEASMRTHVCTSEKTKTPKQRHECPDCGKSFRFSMMLTKHMLIYHSKSRHTCQHCDKIFKCKTTLIEHERIHTGEKPFVCEYCGKAFAQKGQCVSHMVTHTGQRMKCKQCDRSYCRASDLRVHVERAHEGRPTPKNILCSICGRAYRNRGDLERHMSAHTEERKYACDECDMRFKSNQTLRKHKITHTGLKPHKCPICPYRCSLKSNLKQHAKKHANEAARLAAKNGEQVLSCEHCSKPFTQQALLLEHIRTTHAKLNK